MNNFNAKCPTCGTELYVGLKKGTGFCPKCKTQFDADKAIKLYQSVHAEKVVETKKVAKGGDYLEVERIIDRAEFYLAKKQFAEAKKELEGALELTNTDYRVYFGLVRVETKNLTDYKNTSHIEFLNKAIECADSDEKATITRLYKDFYRLSSCSDEDIELYRKEENQAIKGKIEKKFKELIPVYMKLENGLKKYPIVFTLFYIAAVACGVLALVLKIEYLYLAVFALVVAGFSFTRSYFDGKRAVRTFNGVLDLYDGMDEFGFSTEEYRNVLDGLKECRVAYSDKNDYTNQSKALDKLCNAVIESQSKTAKDFLIKHPVFSAFVEDDEDELSKKKDK